MAAVQQQDDGKRTYALRTSDGREHDVDAGGAIFTHSTASMSVPGGTVAVEITGDTVCVNALWAGEASRSSAATMVRFATAREVTITADCYGSPICFRIARASAVSGRSSSQMIEK